MSEVEWLSVTIMPWLRVKANGLNLTIPQLMWLRITIFKFILEHLHFKIDNLLINGLVLTCFYMNQLSEL